MSVWKKRLVIGLLGLLAVLLAAALCWRSWAHPLSRFLPLEQKTIDQISVACIWDPPESGQVPLEPNLEVGAVTVSAEQPGYAELLDILDRSRFRQDFRNLLPWPIYKASSDGSDAISMKFFWRDKTTSNISFLGSSLGKTDSEKGGFLLLHPVDTQTYQELFDWFFQYRASAPTAKRSGYIL